MICIKNVDVTGWEPAIRGMRNPMNSLDRSDSEFCSSMDDCEIGDNDHKLMMKLTNGGAVHAKYRRMIAVYLDITAPLYWWKEFDTYKVGTVVNSCSTMHKIHAKDFTLGDFSCEHLTRRSRERLEDAIDDLNYYRKLYLDGGTDYISDNDQKDYGPKDKEIWWQLIQLLPSSYNQRRTVMLNYEVLTAMYRDRKNHKLDEWRELCRWIESLPYSEFIVGEERLCEN